MSALSELRLRFLDSYKNVQAIDYTSALEAEVERLQGAVVEAATQEGQRVAALCDALVRTAERERDEARAEVERLGARVTEETRLRNHWRGKAEQFRGKVERLREAHLEAMAELLWYRAVGEALITPAPAWYAVATKDVWFDQARAALEKA